MAKKNKKKYKKRIFVEQTRSPYVDLAQIVSGSAAGLALIWAVWTSTWQYEQYLRHEVNQRVVRLISNCDCPCEGQQLSVSQNEDGAPDFRFGNENSQNRWVLVQNRDGKVRITSLDGDYIGNHLSVNGSSLDMIGTAQDDGYWEGSLESDYSQFRHIESGAYLDVSGCNTENDTPRAVATADREVSGIRWMVQDATE